MARKKLYFFDQFLCAQNSTAKHTPLPIDEFGSGMSHNVCTPACRILQIGCGKAIVHIKNDILSRGQFPKPVEVYEIQRRFLWRLHEYHAGVRLNFLFPFFRLMHIGIAMRNTKPREYRIENLVCRSEDRTACEHMVT